MNCSDPSAPGVASVNEQLFRQGISNSNCASGHYYLVNNYNMYWNQTSSHPQTLGPISFVLPPQSPPIIADVMTAKGVSWKYYSGDHAGQITPSYSSVSGTDVLSDTQT